MKDLFKEVLDMEEVKGVMLFSMDGKLLFKRFLTPLPEEPEKKDWWGLFVASLNEIKEADLVFERERLYIRRTDMGYLFILLDLFAPMAMVRLNCDMLLPSLKEKKTAKGLGRFFKR